MDCDSVALSIVRELNVGIPAENESEFSYSTNGWAELIEFDGIIIWCSETDSMLNYKDLLKHIRGRIIEIKDKLCQVEDAKIWDHS